MGKAKNHGAAKNSKNILPTGVLFHNKCAPFTGGEKSEDSSVGRAVGF